MNFAAKATSTTSQGLLTAFFVRQRHRDGPAPSCCQSSHFPYRGHRQKWRASVAKHQPYTSAQSVYRHCSTSRTRQAANAIAHHCGLSISRLPQSGGRLAHLCQHRHSGLVSRNPEFVVHCSSVSLTSVMQTILRSYRQMSTEPRKPIAARPGILRCRRPTLAKYTSALSCKDPMKAAGWAVNSSSSARPQITCKFCWRDWAAFQQLSEPVNRGPKRSMRNRVVARACTAWA